MDYILCNSRSSNDMHTTVLVVKGDWQNSLIRRQSHILCPIKVRSDDSSHESPSRKIYGHVIKLELAIQQPLRENQSLRSTQYKSWPESLNLFSNKQPRYQCSWGPLRRTYLKPDSRYLERDSHHSETEHERTWGFPELGASRNSFWSHIQRSGRKKLRSCHKTRKLYNPNNSNTCHSRDSADNTEDVLAPPPYDLRFAQLWGKLKVSAWKRNAGRKKGWKCFPYTKSKRQDNSHDSESQSKYFRVCKRASAEVGIMGMPLAILRQVGKPFIPRISPRVACNIQHRANKMRVADLNFLITCSELYYGTDE
jgi:hypothetical protein